MPRIIAQHGFLAICLIILLEESGLPLPIPGDLLLLFAGALSAQSLPRLGLWWALLTLVGSIGSCVYLLIIRRGGRPLIARFGHYLHLTPETLASYEARLQRAGWWGIALGRAVPFVRHPVAIVCGLLNVPWRRYLSAQLVGGAIYTAAFLALGATLGPSVLERVHLPRLGVRLIELLVPAVGLPALLAWLCRRIPSDSHLVTTRRLILGPVLLAGSAGAVSMSATWAAGATIATLFGSTRPLDGAIALAHALVGRGLRPTSAYLVVYGSLLLLCVALGVLFDTALRPNVVGRGALLRQVGLLTLLGWGLLALVALPVLVFPRAGPVLRAWQDGGSFLTLTLAVGILSFSVTTVCGRLLAVATLAGIQD